MKQTLLSLLLVLFSMIGCQTMESVDTITVRPTELTIGPTAAVTETTSVTESTGTSISEESLAPETLPSETQIPTEPAHTIPVESEPLETQPSETQPAETAPPGTVPVETQPIETEPAETDPLPMQPTETEPPQQEETQPVETEPSSTTSTEPTECIHEWHSIYHPEEGYWVAGVACTCGWQIYGEPTQLVSQWNAHSASYSAMESLLYHGGYGSIDSWVVDKPAYEEWVCTHCGEPKP